MISNERAGKLLRIALPIAGLVIIFFSGIFPIEELLSVIPKQQLTASVSSAEVISLTNENRIEDHLPALATNALLTQAAQLKANDMAAHSYYAHVSPEGKTPLYWLELVGYHYLNAGENLVIDRATSEDVVSAWMNSVDHRENILRPQFTEIGVGVADGVYEGQATTYVVQEFGTPYPNPPLVRKAVAVEIAPVSVNTLKLQPVVVPIIPTTKSKTIVATKPTATFAANIAALAAPIAETIQVHSKTLATTSATTISTSSMPQFSLPMTTTTVVSVPTDRIEPTQEIASNIIPLGQYQTTVGKQRVDSLRTRLQTYLQALKTFIF